MMKKTIAAMNSLGVKGNSLSEVMKGFDSLKGVSFAPGKAISCLECGAKSPLRKSENHYLCESCFKGRK